MPNVTSGALIEGFEVGARIHIGGMADLYDVRRPGDATRMIMKVPRVGANESSANIISFETEATILPALTGSHVPRFIAAGDITRVPYLVMERIEGTSLEAFVRGGALPVADVIRVGAAIADALNSLHQQDVVHHDVKPDNVILTGDGTAVLIDYGFAHHSRFPDLLDEEAHAAGAAVYISPEGVLHVRSDPRSDIFSLGVVLYEMVTGRFPFGEPDTDVRNRLWLDPVPPAVHSAAVPPWLQEIILRCLETKPELRYQSAAHVAFDLRNPEQVVLTKRATKSEQAGLFQQLRRFLKARREHGRRRVREVPLTRPPIIMVAVDTTHLDDERQPAIRNVTLQILSLSTEFRLLCIAIVPAAPLMKGVAPNETTSGIHLEHLIRLRHWVDPLRMPAHRISLHVIESPDPAEALLAFARLNNVDLIVLGAPGPTQPERSWWSSVASKVTANAHCSVHVVRVTT